MSILDDAISRLSYHALATKYDATHYIKAAPVTPPESGGLSRPFAVSYFNGGTVTFQEATTVRFFANFAVDFHFALDRLKTSYEQVDTVVPDFMARLAGDPTLNDAVDTIQGSGITIDPPNGFDWNGDGRPDTLMVRFNIPVKYLETPTT